MKNRLKVVAALVLSVAISAQTSLFSAYNVKAINIDNGTIGTIIEKSSLGGFELVSKKIIKDLNCNVYEYKHTKSGARLIYLDNKSDEKMFSVNFRTPTKDNTGVNHIIEHSVLQGSKKYPLKDPFIQMSNRSLNTFLNAMTGSDYTMYPVSSKNNKDFENLMNVYLDAVFYPNMVKDKRIFQEEGWRYELNSKDEELKYNGIVYSEMKGNYSSPDWVLHRAIAESLFPDTSYKYDAGGNPEYIPNLTYENFLKTYEENYSPSNSYFFLSGNLDITKTLKFIGEEYLNNFNKKETNTKLQLQEPFKERKVKVAEYSVTKETPIENKTYLSSNYVVSTALDKDTVLGFAILQQLLTGTASSPLSKALKENGFGENVSATFNFENLQPVFSITAQNVNESQSEKFQKIISGTLESIIKEGFDSNLVNSVFNAYELSNRVVKVDSPIMYNTFIMRSWLYEGDPTLYLTINSDLAKMKEKVKNRYFETLIKEYLIDNKHSSLVILKPVVELQEKNEAVLNKKLAGYKASLSQEKINELIKENKELKLWQETPNSKEALATLPSLTRKDIDAKVNEYVSVEKDVNGVKVLHHPIFTNGVDYVSLYFDTSTVPQEKLGYIYLLEGMLKNIDTKNYTKEKLSEEILLNSGGITMASTYFTKYEDPEIYYPKIMVNILSLTDKLHENFDILEEIIYNSKLDDKKRIKEMIDQMRMNKEIELTSNGIGIATTKLSSYISESGKYSDYRNEEFYKFLSDLSINFENNSHEIIKKLEEVRDLIFNKQDLLASYTGGEDSYKVFENSFNEFSKNLKNKDITSHDYIFDASGVNEGLIAPSMIQYVAKGGKLKNTGYENSGKLIVLQNILDSEYLWSNIRIKGGAYGAGMVSENSNIMFYSFMDPNLKETIDAFDKIPEYLKNFSADENQMTNYVIGTIGKLDRTNDMISKILGPAAYGIIADNNYITGAKQSDLQKQREEIISTTAEDIRDFAEVIDSILKQNYLCVVGGETKIRENKQEFVIISDVLNSKEESMAVSLEKKTDVAPDKKWNVRFSESLDKLTVNTSNVFVLDEENHQVKVKVTYENKIKSIIVEPMSPYQKGRKYTLVIKGVQSLGKEGHKSKALDPLKMEFTISNFNSVK